jgi:hypothetical protein
MPKDTYIVSEQDNHFIYLIIYQKLSHTKAYMQAYNYDNYNCAANLANNLLKKPHIQKLYNDMQKEVQERFLQRAVVNKEWVLDQLLAVHKRCMQMEPVLDKQGQETGIFTFDAKNALQAIKMIGNHIDVDAFVDTKKYDIQQPARDITPHEQKMLNTANKIGFFLQKALQAQKNQVTDIN